MESKKFSWLRYLVIGTSIFVLEYIYFDIIIIIIIIYKYYNNKNSWYSRDETRIKIRERFA